VRRAASSEVDLSGAQKEMINPPRAKKDSKRKTVKAEDEGSGRKMKEDEEGR
jgi:hypothetical protein